MDDGGSVGEVDGSIQLAEFRLLFVRGEMMGKTSKFYLLVGIVILCNIQGGSAEARSTTEEISYSLPAMSVGSAVVLGFPGIAVGIGNLQSAVDGTCPQKGHLTTGYIFGSLNLAAGAFVLGFYIYRHDKIDADWVIAVGIGQIVIGASDIGFSIWASSQPERPEQKITLAPMIMPDVSGNAAFGVGLQLVNW